MARLRGHDGAEHRSHADAWSLCGRGQKEGDWRPVMPRVLRRLWFLTNPPLGKERPPLPQWLVMTVVGTWAALFGLPFFYFQVWPELPAPSWAAFSQSWIYLVAILAGGLVQASLLWFIRSVLRRFSAGALRADRGGAARDEMRQNPRPSLSL